MPCNHTAYISALILVLGIFGENTGDLTAQVCPWIQHLVTAAPIRWMDGEQYEHVWPRWWQQPHKVEVKAALVLLQYLLMGFQHHCYYNWIQYVKDNWTELRHLLVPLQFSTTDMFLWKMGFYCLFSELSSMCFHILAAESRSIILVCFAKTIIFWMVTHCIFINYHSSSSATHIRYELKVFSKHQRTKLNITIEMSSSHFVPGSSDTSGHVLVSIILNTVCELSSEQRPGHCESWPFLYMLLLLFLDLDCDAALSTVVLGL